MNTEEEEKVINSTILDPGVAKPISVSKEEALKIAHEQAEAMKEEKEQNFAEIKQVTPEELDEQKVNEVNDFMKNDYVKIVEMQHSKKTYIILFLVLLAIIGIIVFEVIYFGGKEV